MMLLVEHSSRCVVLGLAVAFLVASASQIIRVVLRMGSEASRPIAYFSCLAGVGAALLAFALT